MTTDLRTLSPTPKTETITLSLKELTRQQQLTNSYKNAIILSARDNTTIGQRLSSGIGNSKNMAGSIYNNLNGNNYNYNYNYNNSQLRNHKNMTNQIEMMNAIEELRRENERIVNELGATQDLLDLFERYRDLIQEHMDICVCAGKDHLLSKWIEFELNYKRMLPIKRFQSQISNDFNNRINHCSKSNYNSSLSFQSNDEMTNFKKIVSIKCESSMRNGNVKYAGPFNELNQEQIKNLHEDVTVKMINGENNQHGQRKSMVRSFLDKIRPVNCGSNLDGNKLMSQNNALIRKRSAVNDPLTRIDFKKIKNDSFPVIKRRNDLSNDREVERLDKLNNALDQILMGRFDAISQLETFTERHNDDNNDEEEIEDEIHSRINDQNTLLLNGQINNTINVHNSESDDEDDEDQDDDDSCFNSQIGYETNDNNNNNFTKYKSDINTNHNSSSTILSAVLKSGLKPYNNYSNNGNDEKNCNNNDNNNNNINPVKSMQMYDDCFIDNN